MNRAELLAELNRPRGMSIGAPTWEAAAVLAGLRVAVNDGQRATDRDRGESKNWLADIWGVIGELVALRRVNEATTAAVRHAPIDFERPVDEVDLVVATDDGDLRLEAKAHLLEPGKSWFMVNARARDRSRRRGAVGYVPVVSALGASRALVGRLIGIEQMQAWEPPDKPLRDPAVGLRLTDFCDRYLDERLGAAQAAVGNGAAISRADLNAIASDAGNDLERWRQRLPPLADLSAAEVVGAVRAAR